ncbi:hypothetical protein EMIT0P218_40101 [Pseudomonas sp. IT-P218]
MMDMTDAPKNEDGLMIGPGQTPGW